MVGRFDGVHLGHQHLLAFAQRVAQKRGWRVLAYTFPPDPPALLPLSAKVTLLQRWADEVEVGDWPRLRNLTAQEFLQREVVGRLSGRVLVMGPDHRFGRDRQGDSALAQALGKELGLEVLVVPPLVVDGEAVSSRRIRKLLQVGEVAQAQKLLGRPPVLFGRPVSGAGLAKTLGFPTINLACHPVLLLPRDGVYLAWAFWAGGGSPALFYSGKRPTFPGLPPSAEVHLLSSPPSDPPEGLEVHLLEFFRPDLRFPSPAALVKRVEDDVAAAKARVRELLPPQPILFGVH